MAPRLPLKSYYFLEEGQSAIRFNHLTEDLDERIVLKHEGTYLFPNFQRIPTEGPQSAKELVRHNSKEQEYFTKKMMEQSNPPPKKQETALIEERKGEKQKRQRSSRQESQSQTQQEDKNKTHTPFKKKIPDAYHEEEEAEEEIRVLITTKYKKTQEGMEVDNDDIEIISKDKKN
ncbi:hypothetical protein O181_044983 [Austropuccinia psidii MF-1]|uniref:Uncharacterized protein n=1 Tax=Austropuccinia psidii MF-1 TaxID=1389203 RepID=A0A9Q3HH55_9BASI|nr:hypothetical protein [Austropuccinia psidii MF-1]